MCLVRLHDICKALDEAETLLDGMKKFPDKTISPQIHFLENQISELLKEQEDLSAEAEALLLPMRSQNRNAYIAIQLHFIKGYKWEEVAEILGVKGEDPTKNIQMNSYRALERLNKDF